MLGAGLEDGSVLPAKQPAVVVLAPDTLMICGAHDLGVGIRQVRPLFRGRIVNLAVLSLAASRVGTADGEDASVGKDGGGLVTTRDLHVGAASELVGSRVVDADDVGIRAAGDEDTAVGKLADTRAEHIMTSVGDLALGNGAGDEVVVAVLR